MSVLAWVPFIDPVALPIWLRLWMFPPLAIAIAVVYRVTRARDTAGLLRGSIFTTINIILGMWAIAIGVYLMHALVLRYLSG